MSNLPIVRRTIISNNFLGDNYLSKKEETLQWREFAEQEIENLNEQPGTGETQSGDNPIEQG